jgi:hypothetical protein
MASSFQQVGAACAMVLARQAALRLFKDELARRGERSVAMRDISLRADALLRERPELIEQAVERVAAHPEWLPKRYRPVSASDHAKAGTDNATQFAQPQGEL